MTTGRSMTLRGLLVATSVLAAGGAQAQTMRCGTDLVSVGDTMASVLRKCGEPAQRESVCIVPHTRNADGRTARPDPTRPCTNETELTYRPGYGQRLTTLRFDGETLQSIHYGARQ